MGVAERCLKQGAAGKRDGLDDLPGPCQHWESTCVSTTTHPGGFVPDIPLLGPENQHPQPQPHYGQSLLLKYKRCFLDSAGSWKCNLNF